MQRCDHLLWRDAPRLHGPGVEQDAHLALLAALHVDRGYVSHALQGGLYCLLHQSAQFHRRQLPSSVGHAHLHDGLVRRVVAPDDRLLDARGQAVAQQAHLLAHLLDRLVRRHIEVKLEDDVAQPLGRGGLHGVDAADRRQFVFQLARHLVFDLGRAGPRVDRRHNGDGELDIGVEIDRHAEIGVNPHHDAGHQHHGHKDRLADRNVPDFHG